MRMFDGIFEPESLMIALEVMIKLGIGALLGGVIGLEREVQGRPAGVRTHMLVVIGVILFSEASTMFGGGDPTRIAAQIVTGVGFLGAGTILRMGAEVRGLTTAASIWAAAAIGMAVSVGGPLLLVAVAATVLVWVTLAVVDNLSRRLSDKSRSKHLVVSLENRAAIGDLLEAIHGAGGTVQDVRFSGDGDDVQVTLAVKGPLQEIAKAACAPEDVKSATWTG